MKKQNQKFEIDGRDFEIRSDVHENKQEWRKGLVIVSTTPHRFVGVANWWDGDARTAPAVRGFHHQGFELAAPLMYIAELAFQPMVALDDNKQPIIEKGRPKIIGMQAATKLHVMVPYDLLAVPNSIEIGSSWSYIIRVAEQPEAFREWMYREYISHFDPPKVLTP